MRLWGIAGLTGWAIASVGHAMTLEAQQALARAAAFAPAAATPTVSAVAFSSASSSPAWLARSTYDAGQGASLVLSTVNERAAAGAALGAPGSDTLRPTSYDLSFNRAWPSAFSVAVGKYDLDLSPHAGLGAGGGGSSAEAGVMARFGKNLGNRLVDGLGVKTPGAFGAQSRWYVFAASSGTAVGYNLLHRDGDWRAAGLSQDSASALIGDTQAGVAWRKGPMQASMGYIHRDVKIRQGTEGLMGAADRSDDLVALSFSLKPN